MKPRHPKRVANARCCWVCGKPGACFGFSSALRALGYAVPLHGPEACAHAHERCIRREQIKLKKEPSNGSV